MKKILKKQAAIVCSLLILISTVPSIYAGNEYYVNLNNAAEWIIAEGSQSESDTFSANKDEIVFYDKGGAIGDEYENTEKSGFAAYHDFPLPLKGDVSVSFTVSADRVNDFAGIKFLSNSVAGKQANAWASMSSNQLLQIDFSGKLRTTTKHSDKIIPDYNWTGEYLYSFDITFHLTGTTENNTIDIKISNNASNYLMLNESYTNIPIGGGGVLESIVLCTANNRKSTTESHMRIMNFTVKSNDYPSAENKEHIIKIGSEERQIFSGFGINTPGIAELHSDEDVKNKVYDMLFKDLKVSGMRIWADIGIYLQAGENGEPLYDLNAPNPYVDEPFKHMAAFEYQYFSGSESIFDIAKKYSVKEILLAPSGRIPQEMSGDVTDPYTGETLQNRLLPEFAEIYGEGLARMIFDIKDQYGVKVTATSLMNELGGCITDREIVTVIKALRNKLDELGLSYVKILAPEYSTNSLSRLSRFLNYVKEDDDAWNALYGAANHSYGCAVGKSEADFLTENPKPLWMTELCEDGALTESGYPECAHTAGIFLNDLNHMVTDWYYFIGAGAIHKDRLFSVGGDLIYTTYNAASNISLPSEREYYPGYTVRPVYYYMKQIVDAFDSDASMRLCTSSREGDSSPDDYHDNKLYSAAGINPDGSLSVAVLNNTSTEVQKAQFEKASIVRRLSDETITVKIDLSEYALDSTSEFYAVSTSPDGTLVDKGVVFPKNNLITLTVKPSELITLRSREVITNIHSSGVEPTTNNVLVEGVLKQPYMINNEIIVMLAKKDSEGMVSDILYIDSVNADNNGRYSVKFKIPQSVYQNRRLQDYKIYTYHNENNSVNDGIVRVVSNGVLAVDYEIFDESELSAGIVNKYGDDEVYKVVVSFYDDTGKLLGCKMSEEKNISYESFCESDSQSIRLKYEPPKDTEVIKAFVFGGAGEITPMAMSKIYYRPL